MSQESTRTYARLRRDLFGEQPIETSPPLMHSDFESLSFLCMQLDSDPEDPTPFIETDHPDGFNMILLHPETHRLIWCYSIDFEFSWDKELWATEDKLLLLNALTFWGN